MKVSELLVEILSEEGVSYYFTVYAEHIMSFNIASIRASEERGIPRPVNAAFEVGAGFMGAVYARASGKVGVYVFTGGPGVMSAVNPIAMSYIESDPLVVIGTTPPRSVFYKNAIHAFPSEADQLNVLRPITKRCFRVSSSKELPSVMAKAFNIALSGRPGPVYVEIPSDMLDEDAGEYEYMRLPLAKPMPSDDVVDLVLKKLLSSERLVILAGRGVTISGAERELIALAELLDAPICTTVMGKGVIPPTHPLYGGIAAGEMGDQVAHELLRTADLVLAIGVRFSQVGTGRYTMKLGGELIHVNISEDELGRVFKPSIAVVADAREFLARLLDAAKRAGVAKRVRGTAEMLKKMWSSMEREYPKPSGQMIESWEVVAALRKVFDEDTVFVADVGAHRIESFSMPVYKPRTYITTTSYATMGLAVPGAIAAKLARKESNVVAMVGDGGFLMTGLEVVTAVRYKIPVIIVVFNDSSYRVLRIFERASYGSELIHKLPSVDFSALAKSLGANSLRIERREELEKGLEQAISLAKDGPVVVDVQINPDIMPLNMAKLYGTKYISELGRRT